jgi:hypothetical protein
MTHTTALQPRALHSTARASRPEPPTMISRPSPSCTHTVTASAPTGWCAQARTSGAAAEVNQDGWPESAGEIIVGEKPRRHRGLGLQEAVEDPQGPKCQAEQLAGTRFRRRGLNPAAPAREDDRPQGCAEHRERQDHSTLDDEGVQQGGAQIARLAPDRHQVASAA